MNTLDDAARQWPEWKLWTSANGALVCATRRRTLLLVEMQYGLAPTLVEENIPALIERLREQEERENTRCLRKL